MEDGLMPTALQLSRDDWKSYLDAARRRPTPPPPDPGGGGDRDDILARVREVAAALRTRFGARRVVLFGSLAHAAWFARDSDIDMAVEGVAAGQYWEAWRVADGIIPDRPVDLVELETAGDGLRRAIDRYGLDL
jgi:predicted nucleotidyltransferase